MYEIQTGSSDIWSTEPIIFPDEPLKNKLLRNGFWLYFFSFIVAPTGYIIKVFASHELSVADIGIFYSVLWVISLLATYNDLWLTEALQYFLPHYFIDKEFVKAKSMLTFAFVSQFISSIIIIAVLLWVAPWLAVHYFQTAAALPLLQLFCIYFLVINLFQMIQSLFIATQKVKRSQWIEWVRMWTIVLFVVAGFYLEVMTVTTFMWYWLAWLLTATLVGMIAMRNQFKWLRKYKSDISWALVKKWFGYAFWVIIGTNATILLTQIDQQFALYFFGAESAGYRTNYLTLFNSMALICTPIIGYLFPLLNELQKKNEREKIRILNRLLYIGFIGIWLMLGLVAYFAWPQIATLLFGDKFLFSGELFKASAPFLWLVPIMWIQFQNLASHGKVKQRVVLLFIGVAMNCIVSLLLMRTIGIVGIIYGTASGQLAAIIGSLILQRKYRHKTH